MLEGTYYRIWASLRSFGDYTRRWGFALLWVLLGSGDDAMGVELHHCYLEGHQDGVIDKAVIDKDSSGLYYPG